MPNWRRTVSLSFRKFRRYFLKKKKEIKGEKTDPKLASPFQLKGRLTESKIHRRVCRNIKHRRLQILNEHRCIKVTAIKIFSQISPALSRQFPSRDREIKKEIVHHTSWKLINGQKETWGPSKGRRRWSMRFRRQRHARQLRSAQGGHPRRRMQIVQPAIPLRLYSSLHVHKSTANVQSVPLRKKKSSSN